MPVKFVDASALADLLLPEPEAEGIAEPLNDSPPMAPLLGFELSNVRLTKPRRHSAHCSSLTAAFELLARSAAEEVAVDPNATLKLAGAIDLTAYDASYLWFARKRGAKLVTLDKQLARIGQ